MAEFPPDLEDGELWLPSDIIRDVGARRPSPSAAAAAARPPGCSANLARHLAALGLLDRAGLLPAVLPPPHAPPRPLVRGFKPGSPVARLVPAESAVRAGAVHDGGWVSPGSRPGVVWFCSVLRPVQAQVAFGPGRVGLLQAPARPVRGRFVSVPGAGSSRECGGTGVFLPRVFKNEVKKKPYVTGIREQQQQQATRNGGVWEQGMPFQPSADISLPQDWSY